MLKTLRRIVQEVSAASDADQALAIVVSRVKETFQVDACSIFLIDEQRGEYVLSATDGLNRALIGKARLRLGEGLVGLVGEREEPINILDATNHAKFFDYPQLEQQAFDSFTGVPIMQQGDLLGVLVVQQRESRKLGEEEEAFLVTLSTQLAAEIAQARAKGALAILRTQKRRKTNIVLEGIPGAPGIAIGQAVVVYPPADLEAVPDRAAGDYEQEVSAFEQALCDAREEIAQLHTKAKSVMSMAEHALFDAYLRILDSRTLMQEITTEIKNGQWAQGALKRVIKRHVLHFESLEDAYLRERAADFRDLGRRVLSHLQTKRRGNTVPNYPKQTVLVSQEVSATMLMEVPEGQLVGIISASGSGNSHVAILARALGLPTVMGIGGMPVMQLAGQEIIVDGYNGHAYLSPGATLKKDFQALIAEEQQLDQELEKLRDQPAETVDGHRVSLLVNTGLAIDGVLSLSSGAEGIGLYRTEMPFMLRDRFPSESEQRVMYRQLLTTFNPRPVYMRTLDIGGDKALPYFPIEEENPFLGWRGIRVTLDHPEIFLQQVRAMLKASSGLNNLSIMLPMITSVQEVEESQRLIYQAFNEVQEEEVDVVMPKIGLMIEVPAAVYQAFELAQRVDFLSVGTNDLIQYLLAVDRNNPRVAELYNGFHPAVWRALNFAVKAAHRAGKPISICGELASDPAAVMLLLGMGFDGLSMNARSILRVKWVIRQCSFDSAKRLLKEILEMDDSTEIRVHMENALEEMGVGGLIRAGR